MKSSNYSFFRRTVADFFVFCSNGTKEKNRMGLEFGLQDKLMQQSSFGIKRTIGFKNKENVEK